MKPLAQGQSVQRYVNFSNNFKHRETPHVFVQANGSRVTQQAFLHQKIPSGLCHTVQRNVPEAQSNDKSSNYPVPASPPLTTFFVTAPPSFHQPGIQRPTFAHADHSSCKSELPV
jgi:hypothetical protein